MFLRVLFLSWLLVFPFFPSAQEKEDRCESFAPPSGSITYTLHKKSGKIAGKEVHTVQAGSSRDTSFMKREVFLHDRLAFTMHYQGICSQDVFRASHMAWYLELNFKNFFKYPIRWKDGSLIVKTVRDSGVVVKDAEGGMTFTAENGFPLAKVKVTRTLAHYIGKEKVWINGKAITCWKLQYRMKSVTGPETPLILRRKVILFLAPNLGMVKRETYDAKGKLVTYTLISEIKP